MSIIKAPIHCCYVCYTRSNLFVCKTCFAVQYCSKEHQALDAARHLPECERIKEAVDCTIPLLDLCTDVSILRAVENLPTEIEKRTRQVFDPESLLYNNRSMNFQSGYRFVHRALIRQLGEMNTKSSLSLALYKAVALDQFGTRRSRKFYSCTAATLLRLGQEQLAWEYARRESLGERPYGVKYVAAAYADLLKDRKPRFDIWKDMQCVFVARLTPGTNRMVVWILLLHRWIKDLEDLQAFRSVEDAVVARLNYDVAHEIRGHILQTELLSGRKDLSRGDNRDLIEQLKRHREYFLYADDRARAEAAGVAETSSMKRTRLAMKRLMEGLRASVKGSDRGAVDVDDDLITSAGTRLGPIYADQDSPREAFMVYYPLWRDTPGAIDFVRDFWEHNASWLDNTGLRSLRISNEHIHKLRQERAGGPEIF
ncbi:hypothetical protein TWF696_003209 [Orbilia brochopaga]|uniref:MYND-type domain-containing protein n=1 Tax=Orbilia brochopaga TaxID=3140254 RepID=A0AAV9U1K9_9PEZI